MILFNLLSFKDVYYSLKDLSTDIPKVSVNVPPLERLLNRRSCLAYTLKKPSFILEDEKTLAHKKIERQRLWHKILNNLWSQEIFLSLNSQSLNKYSARVSLLKINEGLSDHKFLLLKFSRALFDGSIHTSPLIDFDGSQANFSGLQYSWVKTLKLNYLKIYGSLLSNASNIKNDNIKNLLEQKINLNYLPLFTISNNFGQMVISEPPTDLNISRHSRFYYSENNYRNNTYYGFFFTNYRDAQEYMMHIEKVYKLKQNNLKVFTCNFTTYYNVMRRFDNHINFRLIPDLKEISQLIKNYRYYRHTSFYKKQNFGRNYFQGQPLYFIKNGSMDFSYDFSKKLTQPSTCLFLNYGDAVRVSNKLKNDSLNSKKQKTTICVYNLESFIEDQLKAEYNNSSPFLVLPSKESYLFVKQQHSQKINLISYSSYSDILHSIASWSRRIFWSLTSRKPPIYF